ncbi:MAG: T9SS type A sorting domain-containing protein [Bacteroidota bacterium]|nr:T9SS type A sorting domain-containing protein [Bacteroidota bacterium]
MNRLVYILIAAHCSLLTAHLFAQPCLPNGIIFTSQSQVDSFPVIYPNCTIIEGFVQIGSDPHVSDISNLNGLSVVTYIGGDLTIINNDLLENFDGLLPIDSIGGSVTLDSNPITGLLSSLFGSAFGTSVGGDLFVGLCPRLKNLYGLDSLFVIGGSLTIEANDSLYSLEGIDNIEAGSIAGLFIANNPALSTCEVRSICDYLSNQVGPVEIHNNAQGCNNQAEVIDACESVGIQEMPETDFVAIYPNPSSGAARLRYRISDTRYLISDLYTIEGEKIRELIHEEVFPGEHEIELNVSELPAGIYFVRMQIGDNDMGTKRMIIVR